MKQQIQKAWKQTCDVYTDGKIVNEATLQASLYCNLSAALDASYTLLCEPEITVNEVTYKPDLLLLHGTSIVAAFELKFVPHYFAKDKRDIEKLSIYAQHLEPISLLLNISTGEYSEIKHSFVQDCLFVFAALAQHNAAAVLSEYAHDNASKYPALKGRFLHLAHPVGSANA